MARMISISEDGYFMSSEPLTAMDFVNIVLNAQMQLFLAQVSKAPQEEQQTLREELYDLYNQGASAFLSAFIPDKELRPDLTAEAILKAENEILDDRAGSGVQDNASIVNLADRIRTEMQIDGLLDK